jgi:outer membrane lipoprotein-sorting protein
VITPYRDAPVTRFSVAAMALVLVASVLMTGCGGGTQQNNPSQDSKAQKKNQESSTKQAAQESTTKQEAANRESLSGTVVKLLPDKDKFYVKPPKEDKAVKIKYKPDSVNVTLAGKQAEPDAISEGQQATVKYVKKTNNNREVNLARSIWLQPGSGSTQGNETTG